MGIGRGIGKGLGIDRHAHIAIGKGIPMNNKLSY